MPGGTTNQRGYGKAHRSERERVKRFVASGYATCSRCGGEILPGDVFDLDHSDDRTEYLGPAHPNCNRRAGGRRGGKARARARQAQVWSRRWLD